MRCPPVCGCAQGVLDRVARHSATAAAGVASVAYVLPARVADALVSRLGGRASLVGGELAEGQPLATRRSAAREVAAASVLAAVSLAAGVPSAVSRQQQCQRKQHFSYGCGRYGACRVRDDSRPCLLRQVTQARWQHCKRSNSCCVYKVKVQSCRWQSAYYGVD